MSDNFPTIAKPSVSNMPIPPNLSDYEKTRKDFDWFKDGFSKLDWLPDGGLNNAYESVDRHVKNGKGNYNALIWIGKMVKKKLIPTQNLKRNLINSAKL